MKRIVAFTIASITAVTALTMSPAMAADQQPVNKGYTPEVIVPGTNPWDNNFLMPLSGADSREYSITASYGDEINFWLSNAIANTDYKFKVYAPNGTYIGRSTTNGLEEEFYGVSCLTWGYGTYKVVPYSPLGNGGKYYRLRVRAY